jgi:hypothetical protein
MQEMWRNHQEGPAYTKKMGMRKGNEGKDDASE